MSHVREVTKYLRRSEQPVLCRAYILAEQMGITSAALRNRLLREGTSFRKLLQAEIRFRMTAALERDVPAKVISDELGYCDLESFYRAFNQLVGMGFGEARRRRRDARKIAA